MRDICDVIKRIKAQIPNDHLVQLELNSLETVACYTPPETSQRHWIELSQILYKNLGNPDTEWKLEVLKIVRGDK